LSPSPRSQSTDPIPDKDSVSNPPHPKAGEHPTKLWRIRPFLPIGGHSVHPVRDRSGPPKGFSGDQATAGERQIFPWKGPTFKGTAEERNPVLPKKGARRPIVPGIPSLRRLRPLAKGHP